MQNTALLQDYKGMRALLTYTGSHRKFIIHKRLTQW